MRRIASRAVLAAVLAFVPGPAPAQDRTAELVIARLALMKEVAAWKRANDRPVEDLAREAVVLDRAAADAAAEGLDPASIRPFFEAQIAGAKGIQHCWIARWEAGTHVPPQEPPDLPSEIRPALIEIGADLLAEIRGRLATGAKPAGPDARTAAEILPCLSGEDRAAIAAALDTVRLAR